jgi:hypothetical protein
VQSRLKSYRSRGHGSSLGQSYYWSHSLPSLKRLITQNGICSRKATLASVHSVAPESRHVSACTFEPSDQFLFIGLSIAYRMWIIGSRGKWRAEPGRLLLQRVAINKSNFRLRWLSAAMGYFLPYAYTA